jgi:hypothetical protein
MVRRQRQAGAVVDGMKEHLWTGRPHVDGASPRGVEQGPGRDALALATSGSRQTANAAAATAAATTTTVTMATTAVIAIATATTGGRQSVRSTKGGGGLVSLLRAIGGGEDRGRSEGGLIVERQLLQEDIVPHLTKGREWLGPHQDHLQAIELLVQPPEEVQNKSAVIDVRAEVAEVIVHGLHPATIVIDGEVPLNKVVELRVEVQGAELVFA